MQLLLGPRLGIESKWCWSRICYYYCYYFLSGMKSTSVVAGELFQHSLCKIRVWQGVRIDGSVVETEQTWINKGQNCQQEECPMTCEDLLLNSIWEAKSSSRPELKAPKQARNFLKIVSEIKTYSKIILKHSSPYRLSVTFNAPKHLRSQRDQRYYREGKCSCEPVLVEESTRLPVWGDVLAFPQHQLCLFSFFTTNDVSQQVVEAKWFPHVTTGWKELCSLP